MRDKFFDEHIMNCIFVGFQVQYVRDPDVAVAVMKQSDCKGYVLERVLSCPAWAPIISLERYARTYSLTHLSSSRSASLPSFPHHSLLHE